jgi:hypothetical protein
MSDAAPPAASPSESQLPPAPTAASVKTGWLPPLLIAGAFLAFYQLSMSLRSNSLGAVLTTTVISLGLLIWYTASLARSLATPQSAIMSALVAAVVILPLRMMFILVQRRAIQHVLPPWSWMLEVPGLPDVALIWFAVSLGVGLSRIIRTANLIPPVAAVLALVDVWTVLLGGPVQKLIESNDPTAQAVTQAMTVKLPAPQPTGAAPFPPAQVVGFADFLFIAFFVAAIVRFVPDPRVYRRMLWALIVVLCGYMLLIVFRDNLMLPALVPMAVVMIALHWRHFHYDRSEAFALLYAVLFIALIAVGFWFYGRKPAPPAEPPRADAANGRTVLAKPNGLQPPEDGHTRFSSMT